MNHGDSAPSLLTLFRGFTEEKHISPAYLVGGAVRDLFLGLAIKDADIAVAGSSLEIAERFSRKIGATFVTLDREWGTGRVVRGKEFLDISPLRGGSIAADLSERDITINAMAIPLPELGPEPALSSVIDPHGGREDLSGRVIRMVSEENLKRDPLRVLRVYRFSATLSFTIEPETRAAALRQAFLLPSVAAERISEELRQILRLPASSPTVLEMISKDILSPIIPGLSHDRERICLLYSYAEQIMENPCRLLDEEGGHITSGLTPFRVICLKLSLFFSHPDQAREACLRLRLSGRETEMVHRLVSHQRDLSDLHRKSGGGMDYGDAVRLLRDMGSDIHLLTVSFLASSFSPSATVPTRDAALFCRRILSFYHNDFLKRKGLLPLITGDDLRKEFGLSPSPLFGDLLSLVENRVLLGEVTSRGEAFALVRETLGKGLGI